MLRLQKVFSLEDDVLPHLPPYIPEGTQQELPPPSENENLCMLLRYREPHRRFPMTKHDHIQSRNLKIVGQERDHLIYSYDSYFSEDKGVVKKTLLEMLDMKTRKRTLIYTHHATINVVSATVNSDKNLLVFTIFNRLRNEINDEYEDIYETCIVEILPQCRLYSLGDPSRKYQRVQFLDFGAHNDRKQTRVYYLLFILHKEYIHAYSLPTALLKPPQKPNWRITEQPRKEFSVAKKFLWYQWDMTNQNLYYVYTRQINKDQGVRTEYMLKSVGFNEEGRPETIFDLPVNIKSKRNYNEDTEYVHLPFSRTIPDVNFHMEIVRIDNSSLCACFQSIEENANTRTISVSVILLHNRSKLEFTIPMNNFSPGVIHSTRVFFTSLVNMLVIYIPGHYLQFVDCGSEHDPCPNLVFTGPEMATPLPFMENHNHQHSIFLSHFEITPNDDHSYGFSMYDCQQDSAYRYWIDEQALLNVFEKTSSSMSHVQAAHLAIAHVQQESFVKKFITHLCDTFPHYATAEVLKEILIGCTYMSMKNLKPEQNQLRQFPITSIPSYAEPGEDPVRSRFNRQVSTAEKIGDLNRKLSSASLTSGTSTLPVIGNVQFKKKIDQFWVRFFGSPTTENAPKSKFQSEEDDEDYVARVKFTENLTEYLTNALPKETKTKCSQLAKDYVRCQATQASFIWSIIDNASHKKMDDKRKQLLRFQLLEHFYCAIEEFSFPFPSGFHSKFAILAFDCLPRHIFVQYLERGILRLTSEFLDHISQVLTVSTTLEDSNFKLQLISQIKSQPRVNRLINSFDEFTMLSQEQRIREFMRQHGELSDDEDEELNASFLEEYEDEIEDNMVEKNLEHKFLPMTVFLQHLKSKERRDGRDSENVASSIHESFVQRFSLPSS